MVDEAIKKVIAGVSNIMAVLSSVMALKVTNENAVSVEAGGVFG